MKPMLFNTEMVMAVKDGRKTATRRIIKPQPKSKLAYVSAGHGHGKWHYPSEDAWKYWDDELFKHSENLTEEDLKQFWTPPAQPGDILYVRETWSRLPLSCDKYIHVYRADYAPSFKSSMFKWHPSIHMPKEAARLFLRATSVRAERLQDITSEQIDAEGCKEYGYNAKTGELMPSSPTFFKISWDNTVKKSDLDRYGWNANPWVWVIEFERISKEEALKNGI